VSLLGVLVPDAFPNFPLAPSDLIMPNLTTMMQTANGDNDIALQIGPLRR
jgi:hypothetical protein